MRALALATCLVAGCSAAIDPAAEIEGTYALAGSSRCDVTPEGEAVDSFAVTGEIRIDTPPATAPEGCAMRAVLSVDTCEGCAPPRCELCLRELDESGGLVTATLAPGFVGGIPACTVEDFRGGVTTDDLLFAGDEISGTFLFGTVSRQATVLLDVTGSSSIGTTGPDRPSTLGCSITALESD